MLGPIQLEGMARGLSDKATGIYLLVERMNNVDIHKLATEFPDRKCKSDRLPGLSEGLSD